MHYAWRLRAKPMSRSVATSELRRLIDSVSMSPMVLESAEALLAPLRRYDDRHDGDLIHTLMVYFDFGMNMSRAAEALFLHRNGLMYRLNRVEDLLGISLSDRRSRLALELVLQAIRSDGWQRLATQKNDLG